MPQVARGGRAYQAQLAVEVKFFTIYAELAIWQTLPQSIRNFHKIVILIHLLATHVLNSYSLRLHVYWYA